MTKRNKIEPKIVTDFKEYATDEGEKDETNTTDKINSIAKQLSSESEGASGGEGGSDTKEKRTAPIRTDGLITSVPGKPGFDPDFGKYEVLGVVTLGQIHVRKGAGTNIAPASGYHILELETGREMLIEKQEGIKLALEHGMRNAYVRRQSKTRKTKDGEVIQRKVVIYLNPHVRSEAFTRDGRIVTAFKLTSDGKIKRPYEINVKREQCSDKMWEVIMEKYNNEPKVKKKKKKDEEVLEDIKSQFESQTITNPFNN